jgi:hypothetical protein
MRQTETTFPRLGALLFLVLTTHAHATVLCATRSGAVVADQRCRRREVQLEARDLGVIGLAGLPGPEGPTGPAGTPVERPFRIVDANGIPACRPLSSNGLLTQCVLEPDSASAPVQLVFRQDGSDPADPQIFYPAPGCEGPAYTSEPTALIARAAVLGPRLFVPNGPVGRLAVLSYERARSVCSTGDVRTPHGTCCSDLQTPSEYYVAPAREIELSALGLTAPLRGEKP